MPPLSQKKRTDCKTLHNNGRVYSNSCSHNLPIIDKLDVPSWLNLGCQISHSHYYFWIDSVTIDAQACSIIDRVLKPVLFSFYSFRGERGLKTGKWIAVLKTCDKPLDHTWSTTSTPWSAIIEIWPFFSCKMK